LLDEDQKEVYVSLSGVLGFWRSVEAKTIAAGTVFL